MSNQTISKVYTEAEIAAHLTKSQQWLERGVLAIYARQTSHEQQTEQTIFHNQVGFNAADASYMSYVAKWLENGKHLSGKHVAKVRGRMQKYAGQLTKIANGEVL
jgi:hypothetical protein